MDFHQLKLLILDVDGVLTDGRLLLGTQAEALPFPAVHFSAHDGYGVKLWHHAGGKSAVLSGRDNPRAADRARSLGVPIIHIGIENKLGKLDEILAEASCSEAQAVFIGDDGPDRLVMRKVGWPVAVANATGHTKRIASYVTRRPGGDGAVAEVVELILRKQRRWTEALEAYAASDKTLQYRQALDTASR